MDCEFQQEIFAVLWYNSSDYVNTRPILDYRDSVKTGPGYASGEFDVYPNGTLIINHVLEKYDGIFTAAYIQTQQEGPVFNEIRVSVIGKLVFVFHK